MPPTGGTSSNYVLLILNKFIRRINVYYPLIFTSNQYIDYKIDWDTIGSENSSAHIGYIFNNFPTITVENEYCYQITTSFSNEYNIVYLNYNAKIYCIK